MGKPQSNPSDDDGCFNAHSKHLSSPYRVYMIVEMVNDQVLLFDRPCECRHEHLRGQQGSGAHPDQERHAVLAPVTVDLAGCGSEGCPGSWCVVKAWPLGGLLSATSGMPPVTALPLHKPGALMHCISCNLCRLYRDWHPGCR